MIVEVAYAIANKQSLISIEVENGTTLKEAVLASGILDTYKEIDLSKDRVGIFSKFATLETVLERKTELRFIDLSLLIQKKFVKRGQLRVRQCESIKRPNSR